MTTKEIKEINELQKQGFGYKKIASLTGLNENTVKAYLRRHPIESEEVSVPGSNCKYCGTPVTSLPKHKVKQFCCDACRMKWWKEHNRITITRQIVILLPRKRQKPSPEMTSERVSL